VHVLLVSFMSKLTSVLNENSNFQMVGLTHYTPNCCSASRGGNLMLPPPTTLTQTFMATQIEVLRQILQAQ
jgi:hypothetical protein